MFYRKTLQTSDIDGVIQHSPAAPDFAGMFTNKTTYCRHGIVLAYQAHCVCVSALPDKGNVTGNIHTGRTLGYTRYRLIQVTGTSASQYMFFKILPEPSDPLQHHLGCFIADGTVGGIENTSGRPLNDFYRLQSGISIQHILKQFFQLPQPHTAGNTFSTGLGMAHFQERCRHIHRT